MRKKWLMMASSAVLAIGLLTGCGSEEAEPTDDLIQQPPASEDQLPEAPETGDPVEEPTESDVDESLESPEEPADADEDPNALDEEVDIQLEVVPDSETDTPEEN